MKKIAACSLLLLLGLMGCTPDDKPADHATLHDNSLETVKRSGFLRWGADVVGGEPYVSEDQKNPGTYIGFEVDIAASIAKQLGVKPKLIITPWDNLIPALQRGDFDMAINGIESTEDRSKIIMLSEPYFIYSQQITIRKGTQGINSLEDLKGKKVATLSGTAAEDLLRAIPQIQVQINPEVIYSYRDLENGKVDAVVLDSPIAAAFGATNPKLQNIGEPFGEGIYVIAFRKDQILLKNAVNNILQQIKANGELKGIYEKWKMMSPQQEKIGIR
ncbi:MAG: ABC transporter substrate-binding protein [Candidatus Competibacteraceae bacterium]